jgi:multiple antibiotic resistance protein
MLTIAMVAGNVLLSFFGLSLAIVRIGGGLLVIASAWKLVNSPDGGAEHAARAAESFTPEMAKARAFYPLTFPISCGPGSIAAAITVGATLREPDHIASLVRLAGSLPGILVTSFSLYICLRFAAQFLYRLGDNGTAIFMRLSAFVLLCLGVQILWYGVHELLLGLMVEAMGQAASHPAP